LRLDHVTAVLAGGLIRLDSGNMPANCLPVQVSASNSIFSNTAGVPFVGMTGNAPPQDFHELLFWVGRTTFTIAIKTMWSIASTQEGGGTNENLDSPPGGGGRNPRNRPAIRCGRLEERNG